MAKLADAELVMSKRAWGTSSSIVAGTKGLMLPIIARPFRVIIGGIEAGAFPRSSFR